MINKITILFVAWGTVVAVGFATLVAIRWAGDYANRAVAEHYFGLEQQLVRRKADGDIEARRKIVTPEYLPGGGDVAPGYDANLGPGVQALKEEMARRGESR